MHHVVVYHTSVLRAPHVLPLSWLRDVLLVSSIRIWAFFALTGSCSSVICRVPHLGFFFMAWHGVGGTAHSSSWSTGRRLCTLLRPRRHRLYRRADLFGWRTVASCIRSHIPRLMFFLLSWVHAVSRDSPLCSHRKASDAT